MVFTTFTNGTVANADEVNDNFNEIIQTGMYGNCPIGTVLPWLKTYTNTPSLPTSWVECDGSTLSDSDSVYDGQTLPDLNGDNRFLRGSSSSGGTGGTTSYTTSSEPGNQGALYESPDDPPFWTQAHTHTVTGVEPPYYNVVWIMRIK
jgi:hypothetical protein